MNNTNDYEEFKRNYMIVMEYQGYVVLNDGRIFVKTEGNRLNPANENDEIVKQIRTLMKRREDAGKPRRIDRTEESNSDREI